MGALHAHARSLEEELAARGAAATGAHASAGEAAARAEAAEARVRALEAEAANLGRQVALLQVRREGAHTSSCLPPPLARFVPHSATPPRNSSTPTPKGKTIGQTTRRHFCVQERVGRGEFNAATTRVLHFKYNPEAEMAREARDARLAQLQSENEALRQHLQRLEEAAAAEQQQVPGWCSLSGSRSGWGDWNDPRSS